MTETDAETTAGATAPETGEDTDTDARPAARPRVGWALAGAVLAVACLVLVAWTVVGGDDEAGAEAPPTPASDSVDAGFARDMAIHHQQAVDMSFIVRDNTDDEEVRSLAYDIINTQANQRGMMLAMLEYWDLPVASENPPMSWMDMPMDFEPHDGALMPGMATDTQLDELRQARGTEAEVLYLQLMTEHHRAGAHMAQAAVDQAENEQLSHLAQTMVDGQEAEIELMTSMLADRGAEPLS